MIFGINASLAPYICLGGDAYAVSEVESFDENVVALATSRGLLVVRGEELHLQSLSIDGGCVTIHGQIAGLNYEELRKSGGFLRRLLG